MGLQHCRRLQMACVVLGLTGSGSWGQGKVAVFDDPEFPIYATYQAIAPAQVVARLQQAGIAAETLDAAALADPQRFSAREYAACVHLFGNTFPQAIAANLRAFHQAGGCILSTGVPFCHPCIANGSAGWHWEPSEGYQFAFTRLQERTHGGTAAVQARNPGLDFTGITSSRISTAPGQRLTISGWVRGQGSAPSRDYLFVRFFDKAGTFLGQDGPSVPVDASDWTRIEKTVIAPASARQADVSLQIWTKTATVALDDVVLLREGSDENLCPNPGFERTGGQWTDVGHTNDYFGHEGKGLGLGVFSGPVQPGCRYAIVPGNPWELDEAFAQAARGECQWLYPPGLDPADEVVPIIQASAGELGGPPVAGIKHRCVTFNGAVDVWLGTQLYSEPTSLHRYVGTQIVLRAVAWVLREKGLLSPERFAAILAEAKTEPWPQPEPDDLEIVQEPRPYPTFFPKSDPPAETLVVADMKDCTPPERYLLSALQGLVNRGRPEVYLIFNPTDEMWLQRMLEKGYIRSVERVADPMSLIPRYRSAYEGVVVEDPDLMVSRNITCMVAGVRNLLPVTPELAERLGLPIREDLRGRFKTNVEAFRWAFDTMLPELNHFYGIGAHPDLAFLGNFDTYIQHKGMCIWITGRKDGRLPGADSLAERDFFARLFAKLPPLGVWRGFWWHGEGVGLGEGGGVEFAGDYGQVTVVSDYIPNLSVHSGIRIDALKQKPFPAPPKLDRTKAYCAFTMSDGDNLNTLYGFFPGWFTHPLHGKIPMGWGMGPSIIDLMPAVAEWYYERQTPADEFLADVSGIGYVFPQTFGRRYRDREKVLGSFLDWTNLYMQKVDEHTVRPHGGDRSRMEAYAKHIPGLHSIFADYGRRGLPYSQANYFVDGVPVLHAATMWGDDDEWFCDQIRKATDQRPAFFNVFLHNWTFPWERIKRVQDLLGPDYVWVTPSQLAALYKEAEG